MPGLNGKGPMNEGAMTGRGLGRCNANNRNNPEDFSKKQTDESEATSEPKLNWEMVSERGLEMRNGMADGMRGRGGVGRGMRYGMGRRNGRGNGFRNGRGNGR